MLQLQHVALVTENALLRPALAVRGAMLARHAYLALRANAGGLRPSSSPLRAFSNGRVSMQEARGDDSAYAWKPRLPSAAQLETVRPAYLWRQWVETKLGVWTWSVPCCVHHTPLVSPRARSCRFLQVIHTVNLLTKNTSTVRQARALSSGLRGTAHGLLLAAYAMHTHHWLLKLIGMKLFLPALLPPVFTVAKRRVEAAAGLVFYLPTAALEKFTFAGCMYTHAPCYPRVQEALGLPKDHPLVRYVRDVFDSETSDSFTLRWIWAEPIADLSSVRTENTSVNGGVVYSLPEDVVLRVASLLADTGVGWDASDAHAHAEASSARALPHGSFHWSPRGAQAASPSVRDGIATAFTALLQSTRESMKSPAVSTHTLQQALRDVSSAEHGPARNAALLNLRRALKFVCDAIQEDDQLLRCEMLDARGLFARVPLPFLKGSSGPPVVMGLRAVINSRIAILLANLGHVDAQTDVHRATIPMPLMNSVPYHALPHVSGAGAARRGGGVSFADTIPIEHLHALAELAAVCDQRLVLHLAAARGDGASTQDMSAAQAVEQLHAWLRVTSLIPVAVLYAALSETGRERSM